MSFRRFAGLKFSETAKGASLARSGQTVLVLDAPITGDDVPALCERVRRLLEESDVDAVVCDLAGVAGADLTAIEALARMQLTARRLGRGMCVRNASAALEDLMRLVGVAEVLLGRLRRQPEEGKQAVRVEERVEADDPPV